MSTLAGNLLPLAVYLGLFLFLYNSGGNERVRLLLLRSAALTSAYLVLVLEALSLFRGITWTSLAITWLVPGLVLYVYLIRRQRIGIPIRFPRPLLPTGWEWLLACLIVVILSITLTVAWLTPPQTWDSLTYHLSRVAHWTQNRSIGHYISGIERQNSMSPGYEQVSPCINESLFL
jgi:hypothetical protein